MKKFVITLDEFAAEIFEKMEEISQGGEGHKCMMIADSQEEAADMVLERLKEFMTEQFIEI